MATQGRKSRWSSLSCGTWQAVRVAFARTCLVHVARDSKWDLQSANGTVRLGRWPIAGAWFRCGPPPKRRLTEKPRPCEASDQWLLSSRATLLAEAGRHRPRPRNRHPMAVRWDLRRPWPLLLVPDLDNKQRPSPSKGIQPIVTAKPTRKEVGPFARKTVLCL